MRRTPICLLAWLALAPVALADEVWLKDGSIIVGTIVGYEDNSFKVQTSYGFALVRKDKVAAIIPSEVKAEAKPEAKQDVGAETVKRLTQPASEAAASLAQPPAAMPKVAAPEKKPSPPHVAGKTEQPAKAAPAPKKEAVTSTPPPVAPATTPPAQASPAQPAAPAPPATPSAPPIREEVQGSLYISHTYGFRMYKPPSWHIIEGAQKALPTAVVAMGTVDETTLLVVGRERAKDSLDFHAASTERQLREIYENYRKLSEGRTRVAGFPAVQRRYRGTANGQDWSGVVLSLARGDEVFTVLGMTYADSDLIQIQENVIAKTIASLEFTPR